MNKIATHRKELLESSSSKLWGGYVNMLKTLETVFLSTKHWILEFIQNTEDARSTTLSINMDHNSLWILNDGKAFNDDDFYSICDVNSRKKPSLGFRGYIGIGFKSIFRITEIIEIHSGEFHFKFDKKKWRNELPKQFKSLNEFPWEILPIEIDAEKLLPNFVTGFKIYIDESINKEELQDIEEFLNTDFPIESITLLKNVKNIEISTTSGVPYAIKKEVLNTRKTGFGIIEEIEVTKQPLNESKSDYIQKDRFLVIRNNVKVPKEIRIDEETQRVKRSDVKEREIGLIFRLNLENNIELYTGRLSGVYSFLPVEGEVTNLPFGIFGDFIPLPGRDLINYLAKWNDWMSKEVFNLFCRVTTNFFASNDRYIKVVVEILNELEGGFDNNFWTIKLRKPIVDFLKSGVFYLDTEAKLQKLDGLYTCSDELSEILDTKILKKLLPKKKKAAPYIADIIHTESRIQELTLYNLLQNHDFEIFKKKYNKLRAIYRAINNLSGNYYIPGRGGRDRPLNQVPFVLTKEKEFFPPNQVMALNVSQMPRFLEVIMPENKKLLHPEIVKDEEAVDQLRRCGLEKIDQKHSMTMLRDIINSILDPKSCPQSWEFPKDVIDATLFLISENIDEAERLESLIAYDNTIQPPKNLFTVKSPLEWSELWELNFLPGFYPVHDDYYKLKEDKDSCQFFENIGVHGFSIKEDKRLIETAAYAIAKKKLEQEDDHKIERITDHRLRGYDYECKGHCEKVFEIKGMAEPGDVKLQPSEFKAAIQRKEDYILICVYNLPAKNLSEIGYKTISNPEKIWKAIGEAVVPKKKWLSD